MSVKLYAVVARAYYPTDDGAWLRVHELPTFYLHPNVQGITSSEHAEGIVRRMLEPISKKGTRWIIGAAPVMVDADERGDIPSELRHVEGSR